MSTINSPKIDKEAVDPLGTAAPDSLAAILQEVEKHLHNDVFYVQDAVTPTGTVGTRTHIADLVHTAAAMTPFQCTAGNDAFGAWCQVIGSAEPWVAALGTKFDPDLIEVEDVAVQNDKQTHLLQFVKSTVDAATGLAAGDISHVMFKPEKLGKTEPIMGFKMPRVDDGEMVWVRSWVNGKNGGTLDFYTAFHPYAG